MTETQYFPQASISVENETQYFAQASISVKTSALTADDQAEVMAFLAERPVDTFMMAGMIRDNGIDSTHNRGTFYGYRNSEGRLEGVALIGHATLLEARSPRAVQEFAQLAQVSHDKHMLLGDCDEIAQFWDAYADEGQPMRRACREMLFELREVGESKEKMKNLRLATLDDLDLVIPVHAFMAEEESGINPLEVDPKGFRARCARRIEKNRTWVLIEEGRLIFKADVQADTPDMIYLEGVYVDQARRGAGIGKKCLTQLSAELLTRTKAICLLVNETNECAHALYRLCGYSLRGIYDTIFFGTD